MSYGVFVFGICDYVTGCQKAIQAHEGGEVFLSSATDNYGGFYMESRQADIVEVMSEYVFIPWWTPIALVLVCADVTLL